VFFYDLVDDWILYGIRDTGLSTLFRMRVDGSEQQAVFENALLPAEMIEPFAVTDGWIFISRHNGVADDGESPISTLYRLRVDGSEVKPLVAGTFVRNPWVISPDGEYLFTSYGGADSPMLFRMRLDGSDQTHIPLEDYYDFSFSPLFNLPFRAWLLMLIGAVMFMSGFARREMIA
jgi:hypothetical protein